jgi:hypothetical protein
MRLIVFAIQLNAFYTLDRWFLATVSLTSCVLTTYPNQEYRCFNAESLTLLVDSLYVEAMEYRFIGLYPRVNWY